MSQPPLEQVLLCNEAQRFYDAAQQLERATKWLDQEQLSVGAAFCFRAASLHITEKYWWLWGRWMISDNSLQARSRSFPV
ncbi:hypothetical protein [Nitrosomonas ureae]|uniref:hypothetical protein n=1 Tax=Nitrosomonas ureae TaxID=44577 RepID=UPI0011B29FCD|nr:hypothetical protein [Nitrosomonas ureae]